MTKAKRLPPLYVDCYSFYLVCCKCRKCQAKPPSQFGRPRDVLDGEVCRTEQEVLQRMQTWAARGHDACYVGVGSILPRVKHIPQRNTKKGA